MADSVKRVKNLPPIDSQRLLNALRNSATENYKNMVPVADESNLGKIGSIIFQYQPIRNEFIPALLNRIARVYISSKLFYNNLNFLKKGFLENGDTIEDVRFRLCEMHLYDPEVAETELWKREIPDALSAFYSVNYQVFYKQTIQNQSLRKAFLSYDALDRFIGGIVDNMYSSANVDEFEMTKYMLARAILDGRLTPISVGNISASTTNEVMKVIKYIGNNFTFPTDEYNQYGVTNQTLRDNQYLFISSKFAAEMDVDSLAVAFNMDKIEFLGHVVMIDDFGKINTKRLNPILSADPNYTAITSDELATLATVPCVLVDDEFFQIWDYLQEFEENYNGQGMNWQYFFHVWGIYGISPFANAVVFTQTAPSVTAISFAPASVTVTPGTTFQSYVNVSTVGFAPKTVNYSSKETGITVTPSGMVTVGEDVAKGTYNVVATSTFDDSVTGTLVLNVITGE